LDGKEYWVSAWRKESDNPRAPVLSFSIQAKEQQTAPAHHDPLVDKDGEVPF